MVEVAPAPLALAAIRARADGFRARYVAHVARERGRADQRAAALAARRPAAGSATAAPGSASGSGKHP
jgi:hypothetical protein